MNTIPTSKIAYDALRTVAVGSDTTIDEGPSLPWHLLKQRLTRKPTIFIALAPASVGDSGPFTRVISELTKCLPGNYHLLRVGSSSAFLQRNTQSSQHLAEQVTETDDAIEWLHRMRSTLPDVFITNQLFSRPQKGQIDDGRHWERLLPGELFHFPRTLNVTVLLVEFLLHTRANQLSEAEILNLVKQEKISLEVYKTWQAHPCIDQARLQQDRETYGQRLLPALLMLECYSAELMTEAEVYRTVGIMCGHVDPLVGLHAKDEELEAYIRDSRAAGRRIVLLARGGLWANGAQVANTQPPPNILPLEDRNTAAELFAVVDYGLAMRLAENAAVIAQGAVASQPKRVTDHIFNIPRMQLDFADILPKVDLAIHHGGSGKTFAALKAGIPQVIIPGSGDTGDQIHHGARVELIGCGRLLQPRARFDDQVGGDAISEVVTAVQGMLNDDGHYKTACRRWSETFDRCNEVEGVPLAVDTLRRIIAKILMSKVSDDGAPITGPHE